MVRPNENRTTGPASDANGNENNGEQWRRAGERSREAGARPPPERKFLRLEWKGPPRSPLCQFRIDRDCLIARVYVRVIVAKSTSGSHRSRTSAPCHGTRNTRVISRNNEVNNVILASPTMMFSSANSTTLPSVFCLFMVDLLELRGYLEPMRVSYLGEAEGWASMENAG